MRARERTSVCVCVRLSISVNEAVKNRGKREKRKENLTGTYTEETGALEALGVVAEVALESRGHEEESGLHLRGERRENKCVSFMLEVYQISPLTFSLCPP